MFLGFPFPPPNSKEKKVPKKVRDPRVHPEIYREDHLPPNLEARNTALTEQGIQSWHEESKHGTFRQRPNGRPYWIYDVIYKASIFKTTVLLGACRRNCWLQDELRRPDDPIAQSVSPWGFASCLRAMPPFLQNADSKCSIGFSKSPNSDLKHLFGS